MNVDTIPISIVVLRNLDDVGYEDSWTCPTYLLSRELIGQQGVMRTPLPPNGGNPHPLPHVHRFFWHDEILGNIPMDQVVINPHNDNFGAPYEDVHAAHNDNINHNGAVDNTVGNLNVEILVTANPNATVQVEEASNMNESASVSLVQPQAAQEDLNMPYVCAGPDYIPLEQNSPQQKSQNAPSPVFIPHNASMNYNDVPSSNTAQTQTYNISVDGVSEHIAILQELVGNLVTNAHDIIPKLGGSKIVNANCKVVDVEGTNGTNKRCYLQIHTIQEQPLYSSSISLVEISEQDFAETNKPNNRQKKMIIDEYQCRRSGRLALISKGFKDKASVAAAAELAAAPSNNDQSQQCTKNRRKLQLLTWALSYMLWLLIKMPHST